MITTATVRRTGDVITIALDDELLTMSIETADLLADQIDLLLVAAAPEQRA